MKSALVAIALVAAACGRPDIDTAPFANACTPGAADGCPAPYECMKFGCDLCAPDAAPYYGCLTTCEDDGDCPSGFYCNGVNQESIGMFDHVCWQ